MDEAETAARAANSRDPATGLRAVRALRGLTERLEELQVDAAREQGWSWSDVAAELGVSEQAAHEKHAGRREPGPRRG